jgi:hypothetical protein
VSLLVENWASFALVVSSDGRNTSEIVRLCCRRLVV